MLRKSLFSTSIGPITFTVHLELRKNEMGMDIARDNLEIFKLIELELRQNEKGMDILKRLVDNFV